MRVHLPIALLLFAGCSSHASKQDQLNAAANESTPEAADVLTGAARNGMNEEAAVNEAAGAKANASRTASRKKETQPATATIVNAPQPAEPSQDQPGTSNSD